MLRGYVINGSPCVVAGGRLHRMPKAPTPLGEYVEGLVRAIDMGLIEPCPNCGRYTCECWDRVELMNAQPPADPHGDLSWRNEEEIPF